MIGWLKKLFRKSDPPIGEVVTVPVSSDYGYISTVGHKEELADKAIERRKQWMIDALGYLSELHYGIEMTGEDIRQALIENGLEPPHHHNVWGAFIRTAINKGILVDTGNKVMMKSPKAKSRKTPVYKVY